MSSAIATIHAHLEYVAELVELAISAQLYASVAVNVANVAKVALETELVRLDGILDGAAGTATETATNDTWTSPIKTLEWLLKLPTMSLTFDTFKNVLTDAHVELVQLFLKLTDIDPSADDNFAIHFASENGQTEVVKVLLADSRVDPSAAQNYAIRHASQNGHSAIVEVLLADPRVDPTAWDNYAIRWAREYGHTDVVNTLLADPRVDSLACNDWS